ncbi:hypothetical protein TVAG_163460 [Trichomonas vaginalis G3]|uniref:Right handed beta helix domain-containing protein n=1 Tax=Trichomonas vaginalis (strain ATCC PRA-98 / G3) TaxID=412133 RepID=A2DG23_TRIV3|nr:pectin lyase-like family [Trichomonas vaginalis G3]EAY20650.1 hypothetical protein TVAG_163460 [Trichomonas vaginalis G3]KAI5487371.1 pectin lyase-like family [Trichomonas vaginalis G3]|eukprot:XP_001581636.1 hypothetical protein [Trichomonas vaginalis G3]
MFSPAGEKQKKKLPVIKRFAPVLSSHIDLTPSAAPVLEAYIDDNSSASSKGSKKAIAPKSKLYEPTLGTSVSFELLPHSQNYNDRRKNPPGDMVNDLEIPIISISKSHPITPNTSTKFKLTDFIKSAPDGAALLIPDGIYEENIVLKKRINLVSNGKTEIRSQPGKNKSTIIIKGPNISLSGITISSNDNSAITVEYGSVLIENCKLISNEQPSITILPEMYASIVNCDITSKSIGIFSQDGIIESQNTTIHDTTDDGILLSGASVAKFNNCSILNGGKNGISSNNSSRFIIDGCKIQSCALHGINITAACLCSIIIQTSITECGQSCISASLLSTPKIIGCKLADCYGPAVILNDGVGCTMRNNSIEHCGGIASVIIQCNASLHSSGDKYSKTGPIAILAAENSKIELNQINFSNIKGTAISLSHATQAIIDDSSFSHISKYGIISNLSEISNLNVKCSKFKDCQIGLCFLGSKLNSNVTISSCSFNSSRLSGIQLLCCSGEVKIEKCNIKKNHECGILLQESTNVNISNTDISGNFFSGIESSKSNIKFEIGKISGNAMGGCCLRHGSTMNMKKIEFLKNGVSSLSLESKSSSIAEETIFKQTNGYACSIVRHSLLTLNGCHVENHKDVAVQIEGRNSKLVFDNTTLSENGIALIASDSSQVTIKNTLFENNNLHAEVRDNASLKAQFTKFAGAKGPLGIHSISGSTIYLQSCSLNQNMGVALACASSAAIVTSAFISNSICGFVLYSPQALVEVEGGSIEKNGEVGVCIYDGTIKMQRSVVQDHQCAGIVVAQKAKAIIGEIQFTNNGLMNINRE